mgnify:CR=1 FL=1
MIDKFFIEYRFLSNFWPCEIEYEGITYPSVEHAYQASKTNYQLYKYKIARHLTASQAKHLGSRINIKPEHEHQKVDIMKTLLLSKFSYPDLQQKLLDTGNELIMEGNTWHDNFWGSCTCDKCGNKGKNILGKLLMEVRKNCGNQI